LVPAAEWDAAVAWVEVSEWVGQAREWADRGWEDSALVAVDLIEAGPEVASVVGSVDLVVAWVAGQWE
jgi:hypothetical protein